MDTGQVIVTYSRLILGALAVFLAIVLWSKTRDIAWMLMIGGTAAMYAEIVWSILGLAGISSGNALLIGSVPLSAIVLPALYMVFFIAAFLVMVTRRRKT